MRTRRAAGAGLAAALGTLVVLFVAAAVAAASAGAATFCVNFAGAPGCSGTAVPTIGAALTGASGTTGRDTIEIAGGHRYEEGALVDPTGLAVDLVGVGPTPPVLAATPGATVLEIENATATVKDLQIAMSGSGGTGIDFYGALAEGITVAGKGAGSGSRGIELRHGILRGSSVQLPFSLTVGTDAVVAGESTRVETSTLEATAGVGFGCCQTESVVSRVKTIGPIGIRATEGGSQRIEDSLLMVSGETQGHGTSAAILAADAATGPETLTAENVTAVNLGTGFRYGALASGGGNAVTIALRNSIVRGFTYDLDAFGAGAAVNADYDDYAVTEATEGGKVHAGTHSLDLDPGFDPLAGSEIPPRRGLAADRCRRPGRAAGGSLVRRPLWSPAPRRGRRRPAARPRRGGVPAALPDRRRRGRRDVANAGHSRGRDDARAAASGASRRPAPGAGGRQPPPRSPRVLRLRGGLPRRARRPVLRGRRL
jgi:hypothetical protein